MTWNARCCKKINYINVTLPFDKEVMASRTNETINVPQKSYEEILIELIKNNPNITRKEMDLVIGKTTKTVQRIISNSSKIVYVGSSKNGHWEIKE